MVCVFTLMAVVLPWFGVQFTRSPQTDAWPHSAYEECASYGERLPACPSVTVVDEQRIPDYWSQHYSIDGACGLVTLSDAVAAELEIGRWIKTSISKMTCGNSECQHVSRHAHIVNIFRIENAPLWKHYAENKSELCRRNKRRGFQSSPLLPADVTIRLMDSTVNEVYLWHGCQYSAAESIATIGFDQHRANIKGLFGAGTYFTTETCKAFQYARADGCTVLRKRCKSLYCSCNGPFDSRSRQRRVLLCRVLLGDIYYANGPMVGAALPPECPTDDGTGRYDCVVANPGIPNGRAWPQQHREVVIWSENGVQVYPEYMLDVVLS